MVFFQKKVMEGFILNYLKFYLILKIYFLYLKNLERRSPSKSDKFSTQICRKMNNFGWTSLYQDKSRFFGTLREKNRHKQNSFLLTINLIIETNCRKNIFYRIVVKQIIHVRYNLKQIPFCFDRFLMVCCRR